MRDIQRARELFEAYDRAWLDETFHGGPAVKDSDFGHQHGWIVTGGESYSREECFPEKTFPRFPADQALSD